jgi:hypothetical protein
MTQLGRITGPLLNDVLNRDGVDLSFETNLLYIDVNNNKIGVNQPSNVPAQDLDIFGYTKTTDLEVTNQAILDNVVINGSGSISTVVGPLYITPSGTNPYVVLDRVLTGQLEINGNTISNYQPNGSIIVNTSGTGIVDIEENTNITGNLSVNGNINIGGNLSTPQNIIVGDSPLDVVVVDADFSQSLIPSVDNDFDLGADANDSSQRRWRSLYLVDNLTNANLVLPSAVDISNQLRLSGSGSITALQSNDDVVINPNTGITYIERTMWQNSTITNLNNTPIQLDSTGDGYVKFAGTNGVVIPAGTNAERVGSEVGETRWNTELNYMECYDGSTWIIATGPGAEIDIETMQDLGNVWTLILG